MAIIKLKSKYHNDKKIKNKKYLKINKNQLLLLDALLNDGNSKKYFDSNYNLRYSEHSGAIAYRNNKVDRLIISGQTTREDDDDIDILLPNDLHNLHKYEYIFHTHPPTPYPGSRAIDGVLYEFPSINDILHFIYYYNNGFVKGSIIIAPEGIYIIKTKKNIKKIKITHKKKKEEKIIKHFNKYQTEIQEEAIDKHGILEDDKNIDNKTKKTFDQNYYYNNIINDTIFIKKFNKILKKIFNNQIKISYKHRIKDDNINSWIIKSLYLEI